MATEFPITVSEAQAIYDGLDEAEKGKLRLVAVDRLHDWADFEDDVAMDRAVTDEVLMIVRFEDWKSLL